MIKSTLSARQLMDQLVAFPTVSHTSNLELIDFVEHYIQGFGVSCTRVTNDEGTKASLYAHIGPDIEGGVVLSGHTDVVPVDGQDWDTDPFTVVEKDGRLFGRGTCDMKGFVALALSAIPLALECKLKRPLQIAFSYDEELGCIAAPDMIEHMISDGMPRANTVIVGEPSMMKVVTGNKGSVGFFMHFQGNEVHSSLYDQGVSAVMMGARMIEWANQVNMESAMSAPNPLAASFVPPYSTIHVGVISGGTASNIMAKNCQFDFGVRMVPGEVASYWIKRVVAKVAELEAEMKAIHPDAGISYIKRFDLPALAPEINGTAEDLACLLTGDNTPSVVSYGTEAGQFQERGYSAVICGPGDIAQAHQPNEYITIDQFERGQGFIFRLIDTLGSH